MSIIDKIGPKANAAGKKAGEVAQVAAKRSKKLAATARVNLPIAAENNKIKKAQIELGKLYYKDFAAGTAPENAEYLPWCDKITASLKTIEALNESLLAMDEEEPEEDIASEDAADPAVAEEFADYADVEEFEETVVPAEVPAEAPAEEPAAEAPTEEPPIANLYVDETGADVD